MASLLSGCHEAVAPTMQGDNEPLCLPSIASSATHRFDAGLQRRLAHNLLGPEMLQQLLLGNNAIAMAAGAAVLEAFFGDASSPCSLTSSTTPGVTRRFGRLSDYVSESIDARVYDGVHYRTSGEIAAAMGRKIGEYTVQNYLAPVSKSDTPLSSR